MSTQSSPASSSASSDERPALQKVASGQRLVIYAILLNILTAILQAGVGAIVAGLTAIVAIVVR